MSLAGVEAGGAFLEGDQVEAKKGTEWVPATVKGKRGKSYMVEYTDGSTGKVMKVRFPDVFAPQTGGKSAGEEEEQDTLLETTPMEWVMYHFDDFMVSIFPTAGCN